MDSDTNAARHADLARQALLPDEELVDATHASVDHILKAAADHGVTLTGPLRRRSGRQTRTPGAFALDDFIIDWDNQQVTCPNGKISRNWRERPGSRSTLPIVQVTFRLPDCASCPDRSRCTRSAVNARDLTFRPRPQFEALHRLRAEQATTA